GSSSGGSPGSAVDPHATPDELHCYATRTLRREGELTAALAFQTVPRGSDPPSVEHLDRLDDLRDYIREQDQAIAFMQQTINDLRADRDTLQATLDSHGSAIPDQHASATHVRFLEQQVADLESQVTQYLQEREYAGAEVLYLQEQRNTADRVRDQAAHQLQVPEGVLCHTCQALDRAEADLLIARQVAAVVSPDPSSSDLEAKLDQQMTDRVALQNRFDQVSAERDLLNVRVQSMDSEADALRVQIQDLTVEFKQARSRYEVARVNLAGAVKREKGYRDASKDLKRDVTVARTAYADAERSITEQKAQILKSSRQLAHLDQERTDQEQPDQERRDQKIPDHDKPTQENSDQDDQSMESGDREKPAQDQPSHESSDQDMSDQNNSELDKSDHDQRDKDPDYTPTPDGSEESSTTDKRRDPPPQSKKSDTPASSDPAAKPKPKSKSRSTDDPKFSKDTGLEEEDQEPEADTSADDDDDESLNDMLQAQTLMALSRSRSEQRRRDHAAPRRTGAGGAGDPGSGCDSDGDGSSNGSGGGCGGSPADPAGMPLVSTMLPRRLFAPDNVYIAGRQQTRQYNIADVDPWVIQRINTLTIMTMTLEVLSRALPFRPEWIFPSHLPGAAVLRFGQYCSHLITGQNVRDLMAALPWNVLTGANIPEPMSFEITVDGRLGFLIKRYSAAEFQDLIAYWESTHRFPVPSSLIRSDPYLATFVVKRKDRRSHAGARWKQILTSP
ncbi:hypothetical protein PHMEG_00016165, partial [Phytophthora megakarya]